MEKLSELKQKFEEKRPVKWEMIPDIPLNKNQVVMYMPRQLVGTEGEDDITSAMINNYIKDAVMPRANGKTYSREHIAYLTAISILKKSLSVKDIKTLIDLSEGSGETAQYYESLNASLDMELTQAAARLRDDMSQKEIVDLALQLAVSVYARRTLCEQLMQILTEQIAAEQQAEKEKAKEEAKKKETAKKTDDAAEEKSE